MFVRGEDGGSTAYKVGEVEDVNADGRGGGGMGGFEEGEDGIDIFLVVDAGQDAELGAGFCVLDCTTLVGDEAVLRAVDVFDEGRGDPAKDDDGEDQDGESLMSDHLRSKKEWLS
ncbi:uncharacterized protein A4U43_C07F28020 [Asparagus officinalis]|uniref:Uncharacterized protein n=1 Tax=Asparagus officinalis TaxID=4686 RepID=A0A5P1EIK9_ASPOF|nr:uncharacterized protein A4U43_C07F28020 [Asparagus officinalis]